MTTIIYTRTSSKSSFKKDSPERQIGTCNAWLKKNENLSNNPQLNYYSDRCEDNTPLQEREGFKKMINDLSKIPGKKKILVEHVSRLGRSAEIFEGVMEIIKDKDIEIVPLNSPGFFSSKISAEYRRQAAEDLLNEKKNLLIQFQEAKIIRVDKNKKAGKLTLSGEGKFEGRKSLMEKYPRVKELLEDNPSTSLHKIKAKLFEEGIKSKSGLPLSTTSLGNARKLLSKLESTSKIGSNPSNKNGLFGNTIKRTFATKPPEVGLTKQEQREKLTNKFFKKYKDTIKWVDNESQFYIFKDNYWRPISEKSLLNIVYNFFQSNQSSNLLGPNIVKHLLWKIQMVFFLEKWPSFENPDLIPFKNYMYNIKNKECNSHNPLNYNTHVLPYDQPEEKVITEKNFPQISEWFKFLTNGNTAYTQYLFYIIKVIILRIKIQHYFKFIGSAGTGKTTFANLISCLIGLSNTFTTSLELLESNRFELGSIINKLFVIITESTPNEGKNSNLKALTGGDQIRTEQKYKNAKQETPFNGIIMILSNHIGIMEDMSSGPLRRLIPINFDQIYSGPPLNLLTISSNNLSGLFVPELPYFLTYIINLPPINLNSYFLNPEIPIILLNRHEILLKSNHMLAFISQHLIFMKNVYTPLHSLPLFNIFESTHLQSIFLTNGIQITSLYDTYLNFCKAYGFKPLNATRFSETLLDLLTKYHSWNVNSSSTNISPYFSNIALKFNFNGHNIFVCYLNTFFSSSQVKIMYFKQNSLENILNSFNELPTIETRQTFLKEFLIPLSLRRD